MVVISFVARYFVFFLCFSVLLTGVALMWCCCIILMIKVMIFSWKNCTFCIFLVIVLYLFCHSLLNSSITLFGVFFYDLWCKFSRLKKLYNFQFILYNCYFIGSLLIDMFFFFFSGSSSCWSFSFFYFCYLHLIYFNMIWKIKLYMKMLKLCDNLLFLVHLLLSLS